MARFDSAQATLNSQPGFFYWDGRGWPFIALAAHWDWFSQSAWPDPPITAGFALTNQASGPPSPYGIWPYGIHDLRACPTTVLLSGFVIDTLFYAAIWFGVFFGFTSAKRFIRVRRGRCPRCGYDLRGQLGAGCPECGWNRAGDTAGRVAERGG